MGRQWTLNSQTESAESHPNIRNETRLALSYEQTIRTCEVLQNHLHTINSTNKHHATCEERIKQRP